MKNEYYTTEPEKSAIDGTDLAQLVGVASWVPGLGKVKDYISADLLSIKKLDINQKNVGKPRYESCGENGKQRLVKTIMLLVV